MNKSNFTKGFTLAEVLITLLIIGIVASIVIPALINDTQEVEYNVGVKKVQAELSNALRLILVNNGGVVNVGNGNYYVNKKAFRDDFCNVMSCVKTGNGANIFNGITYNYYEAGYMDNLTGAGYAADSSAILNNGSLLYFNSLSGCNNWGVNVCGEIWVDMNGKKAPNMLGKDLNIFYIVRQTTNSSYLVRPMGVAGDTHAGPCAIGYGWSCTAKRLADPEHMP